MGRTSLHLEQWLAPAGTGREPHSHQHLEPRSLCGQWPHQCLGSRSPPHTGQTSLSLALQRCPALPTSAPTSGHRLQSYVGTRFLLWGSPVGSSLTSRSNDGPSTGRPCAITTWVRVPTVPPGESTLGMTSVLLRRGERDIGLEAPRQMGEELTS